MENKELQSILIDLENKAITKHQAYELILILFDVSGQSEQLVCDSYYANNLSMQKECLNCGKLSTEH
jgi:regulator of replication initiation timing